MQMVQQDELREKQTGGIRARLKLVGWASRSWWPERLASLAAMVGLMASILPGLNVKSFPFAGSDFKTLYASSWCFARGVDAYEFRSIGEVFAGNHVVPPASWYAHAPVYPPFTLALLAPLSLVPMVAATYAWIFLSAILMACAIAALARAAGEWFGLERGWRLLVIAGAAALPLVSFGLEMGNVSVASSALCILAVCTPEDASPWLRSAGLAIALVLKPHLAVWVVIGLFFLPWRKGRRIAVLSGGMFAAAIVLWAGWCAVRGSDGQIANYVSMLHAETSNGSMGMGNHELIGVAAQITSLASLTGIWTDRAGLLSGAVLLALGLVLIWNSRRVDGRRPDARLRVVVGWCAFGLLATYHRAHDGIIFVLLLPWLAARLRRSLKDGVAWYLLGLLAMLSTGPSFESYEWMETLPGLHGVAQLLLYRQSSIAALLIAVGVTISIVGEGSRRSYLSSLSAERYSMVRTPARSAQRRVVGSNHYRQIRQPTNE